MRMSRVSQVSLGLALAMMIVNIRYRNEDCDLERHFQQDAL